MQSRNLDYNYVSDLLEPCKVHQGPRELGGREISLTRCLKWISLFSVNFVVFSENFSTNSENEWTFFTAICIPKVTSLFLVAFLMISLLFESRVKNCVDVLKILSPCLKFIV